MKEDYFEIVAGTRRYNACKQVGWRKIICHIAELNDREAFEISLTENLQKKTLTAIDEASAFVKYVRDYGWGGMSDLASKIGKSVSYIAKRIKLLNLPPDVIAYIANSSINISSAEELLYIKDKNRQSELAQLISKRKCSFRKTRAVIKQLEKEKNELYWMNESSICIEGNDFEKTRKSFDKSIIALRIALNKMGSIIQENEEDWIVYDILMQHKNMLHTQIDNLIKYKKKYEIDRRILVRIHGR
jgi:ParB family chromosome partitioning protein